MTALLVLAAAALAPAQAEAKLAALDRAAQVQEARLAAAQAPLAQLLAAAQRLALRPPALALAQPGTIDDAVRTRALIEGLAPEIRRRTAALRHQMIATAAARAELEQALAATLDQRTSATLVQPQSLTARLIALPAPPAPSISGNRSNVYRLPARGAVVTGTGEQTTVGIRARGLTLATRPNAVVVAPAMGRTAYAGPFRGYGDIVILDHGHGWTTLLTGLELATVGSGELVPAGAPIGRMAATAPRLTIELRHAGNPVDVAAMAMQ